MESIKDFTIGHKIYKTKIKFQRPIDVRGVNIDRDVYLGKKSFEIYGKKCPIHPPPG